MSFSKNGKNTRYDKLNMSAESKERILNECLKVLDEEYEKESVSTVVGTTDESFGINRESTDELSLKRSEKLDRESDYDDWFKKLAVASFSIVATGAIIVGAMNYNKMRKKPNLAKETTTVVTTAKERESVTETSETDKKKDKKNKDDSNNKNNSSSSNNKKESKDGSSNSSKSGEKSGKDSKTSKDSTEFADAKSPANWINERLEKLSKSCYYADGSLKDGYEEKTFTSANGKTYSIVGRDFIELTATQDKGNFDVEAPSNVVYFVVEDVAYQLVLDTVFKHKNYGEFKEVSSDQSKYEYLFNTKEDVDYYYDKSEDEYYLVNTDSNKTRKVFDKIEMMDAPISDIAYDWNRKSLKFICDKMGNQQADYDLPGIKCYKMGCFTQDGELVKEISIVEDQDAGNHYYNVINDIENGCIYYVSNDNNLYRIDNVIFDKISKAYTKNTLKSMKSSYPSIFNNHTCQFDEDDTCLGLLRSVITLTAESKFTLLAEDVRYIKTKSNEYIQTSKLNEKIKVVSTSGMATIIEEDENVTYK